MPLTNCPITNEEDKKVIDSLLKEYCKNIVYGFCELQGEVYIWFAKREGFEVISSRPRCSEQQEDDEQYLLSDHPGNSDEEMITNIFKEGGFELQNIENGADGLSLEYRCLNNDVTIEKLDEYAKSRGFCDSSDYKKWVSGEYFGQEGEDEDENEDVME